MLIYVIQIFKFDSHLSKRFIFIWFSDIPSKMLKNAFYFTLKAVPVVKILTFSS